VVLDHDRVTGKFRGWLCQECNSGLGKLGDDIAGLRRAIAYLIAYLDTVSRPEGSVETRAHSTSSDSDSSETCRKCGEQREATDFYVTGVGVRSGE
jgi:hypothetical protein